MIVNSIAREVDAQFAEDVRNGLTKSPQKELPSKYLYDQLGSKLFEAICELPEYGLTRADERLLRAHAAGIARSVPESSLVCELGSGTGRKTRWILEALTRHTKITYFPIEISAAALSLCRAELADIESLSIIELETEYLNGLRQVVQRRQSGQAIFVMFLGSTIGNFGHPADLAFLRHVRSALRPGDFLLLGSDLQKPVDQLLAAYDDPLGVTAAFNLNLLARMNRELGAAFDLRQFCHEARFNSHTSSIEMHLRSLRSQRVTLGDSLPAIDFREGETIWTENSHKYSLAELHHKVEAAGFQTRAQWIDQEWPFAESLLIASGGQPG